MCPGPLKPNCCCGEKEERVESLARGRGEEEEGKRRKSSGGTNIREIRGEKSPIEERGERVARERGRVRGGKEEKA